MQHADRVDRASAGWMHGSASQWLPVICQGTGGIGVEEIMPLVLCAVARRAARGLRQSSTPQLTLPLPKYNGPMMHYARVRGGIFAHVY